MKVLKRRIRERPEFPRNTENIFGILCNECNSIPNEYFTSPIRSMKIKINIKIS